MTCASVSPEVHALFACCFAIGSGVTEYHISWHLHVSCVDSESIESSLNYNRSYISSKTDICIQLYSYKVSKKSRTCIKGIQHIHMQNHLLPSDTSLSSAMLGSRKGSLVDWLKKHEIQGRFFILAFLSATSRYLSLMFSGTFTWMGSSENYGKNHILLLNQS